MKASALAVGDRLLTAEGTWAAVEDLLDTGAWEPVYNLRVADHHTYFVGDDGWGFSVWAHNLCAADFANVTPAMPAAHRASLATRGNTILTDLTTRYPALNIRTIVETQLLRNGGQYYDSAPGLVELLRDIRTELDDGKRGTYNVLVEAANRIMSGHRVGIETATNPAGRADLIDHNSSGEAVQMKTLTTTDTQRLFGKAKIVVFL